MDNDGYAHRDANGNGYTDVHGDAHGHEHGNADHYSYTHGDGNGDTHTDANTLCHYQQPAGKDALDLVARRIVGDRSGEPRTGYVTRF